jgi:hypothetical protein
MFSRFAAFTTMFVCCRPIMPDVCVAKQPSWMFVDVPPASTLGCGPDHDFVYIHIGRFLDRKCDGPSDRIR